MNVERHANVMSVFASILERFFDDFGEVFGVKFGTFGRRISESIEIMGMLQNVVPASKN